MIQTALKIISIIFGLITIYTELKLNFINANSTLNKLKIEIQVDVPEPSYELLIKREYKWLLWIIDGIFLLIILITGYFGFRKKPAGNTMYTQ